MRAAVVIRTKDEAERLRLTLTSLCTQTQNAEVIVVNDGSSDSTPAVLKEASEWMPLRVITHPTARGRSAASNAGAAAASSDLLIFFDGDTLAGPAVVERHLALHEANANILGRGETFHVRRSNVAHVTRELILGDFARIDGLAMPGIYPGVAARQLYELEMDALHRHPGSRILWAAACGGNFSVPRTAFLEAGGFLEELDLNEHRELALRLYEAGSRMLPVDGARSYHLIAGPRRDPLVDRAWEEIFYRKHPIPEVKRLSALWASLTSGQQVDSLTVLEARC